MRWSHTFSTVDVHVAGQPLRLITYGVPQIRATALRDQVAELRERYDHIRRWLLGEPRGRAGMNGAILLPAADPHVDYGVAFLSTSGYLPLLGHGVIALATALIDTGAVPVDGPDTRITFETLAGVVQARAMIDQGRVRTVRFRNVPSFRLMHEMPIDVGGRSVRVDVAYGGAWYAIVRAEDLGVPLEAGVAPELSRLGVEIVRATANALDVVHPVSPNLAGLQGTVFLGAPHADDSTSRNVTVSAEGQIDRSPCGTGMSATMACLAADGRLGIGDSFICESIIDTVLAGRIVEGTSVGDYPAIVTELAGRGSLTGLHQFVTDPADVLPGGFVLG